MSPITAKADLPVISHWIDGRLDHGTSAIKSDVWNPVEGQPQAAVTIADERDVNRIVESSAAAFPGWRSTPLAKRVEIMFKMRELVHRHQLDLARAVSKEHGKTVPDAMGEVARGLENIEFACGIPQLLKGGFSEQVSRGVDVYQIRQPLGVVVGITPFNFPAMVPLWMFANAVACGNCFILKPSEKDPSVSLLLADLWKQAGLPDGVFNVCQGDRTAVETLIKHPKVRAISFVGSTPIAKYIYETGTRYGKRVQALGGAKNHMLVLPDADIDMAADAAISAGFGSAGERCMAISVVVAVGSAAEPLIEAIRVRMSRVKIGNSFDEDVDMGPLISREHRDKVASYVAAAAAEGASVVVDGREDAICKRPGFFLGTSLVDRLAPGMKIYDEEVFGPVLGVSRVDTYREGIEMINNHPFGNGTAIFTRDGGVARQFQFDVEVGMVGINVPIPVPVSYYSFGGWKASLFGDLHMYGPDGVQFYTRSKVVTSRWPDPGTSSIDLGFPRTN